MEQLAGEDLSYRNMAQLWHHHSAFRTVTSKKESVGVKRSLTVTEAPVQGTESWMDLSVEHRCHRVVPELVPCWQSEFHPECLLLELAVFLEPSDVLFLGDAFWNFGGDAKLIHAISSGTLHGVAPFVRHDVTSVLIAVQSTCRCSCVCRCCPWQCC